MILDTRTFPEQVAETIETAINVPGLMHFSADMKTCIGAGKVSAYIDFLVGGSTSGVRLYINSDNSLFLVEPTEGGTKSTDWRGDDVDPDKISDAVVDALNARVRAAA